jgi:hypothetical protein
MADSTVVGFARLLVGVDASQVKVGLQAAQQAGDNFKKSFRSSLNDVERSMVGPELAVKRYAATLRGDGLLRGANNWVAAAQRAGGATKLTEAESARLNATLQKALDKYRALGQDAPKAMVDLERATRRTESAMSSLGGIAKTAVGTFTGFMGAQVAMSALRSSFGLVKGAVIDTNAQLETATLQFRTLMGSAEVADKHVRGLFDFAGRTPFLSQEVITASRMLRTFGGDVLDTKTNLELIGDAAAATSAPINDLGFWVGRLYTSIAAGKPFGEAAMRLTELAVLTPRARAEMERLQKSGADASNVFGVFQADLARFSGSMALQADTWKGVTSTIEDSINLLLADSLKPFFETFRDGLKLISRAMASDDVARAAETFKATVRSAFGKDSQDQVHALAGGMITFGQTLLTVAEVSYRGFHAVRDGVSGLVGTALAGIAKVYEAGTKLTEWLSKVPGSRFVGLGPAEVERTQVNAAMLRTMANEFLNASDASERAWRGQDAFVKSLGGMQGVLGSARAQLSKSATETAAVTTQTGAATNSLGGMTEALGGGEKAAARYTTRLAELRSELSGLADIETAKQWADALKGVDISTVPLEHLTRINAELLKGVDAYKRQLRQVPADVQYALGAVRQMLQATLPPLQSSVPSAVSAVMGQGGFRSNILQPAPSAFTSPLDVSALHRATVAADGTVTPFRELVDVTEQLEVGFRDLALQGRRQPFGPWIEGVDALGRSLDAANLSVARYVQALTIGHHAGLQISSSITAFRTPGASRFGAGANIASSALAVYGQMAAATSSGGGAGRTLSGAATGAMTTAALTSSLAASGAKLGAWGGWPGMAVGAGAGALVGFVRSRTVGKDEKAARAAFNDWFNQIVASFDVIASEQQRAEAAGDDWSKMILTVRDAYMATGRTAEEAMRDLDRLNRATHLSAQDVAAALGAINEAIGEQAADTDRLDSAMERYGISLEKAGDAFQAKTLHGQAKELIEDWRVLADSGMEVADVNEHMAAAMNQYLNDSIRTDTAIPSIMKPILDSFAKQGLLFDEVGRPLDELAVNGLNFADVWTNGLDKIATKLDQLIERLIQVGSIMTGIPLETLNAANTNIAAKTVPVPRWAAIPFGGYVDLNTGQFSKERPTRMHTGGVVGRNRFGGTDVPTILQTGEGVVNRYATSLLGGKSAIDALNRGTPIGLPSMTGGFTFRDPMAGVWAAAESASRPIVSPAGNLLGNAGSVVAHLKSGDAGGGSISVRVDHVTIKSDDPRMAAEVFIRELPMAVNRNQDGLRTKLRKQLK